MPKQTTLFLDWRGHGQAQSHEVQLTDSLGTLLCELRGLGWAERAGEVVRGMHKSKS